MIRLGRRIWSHCGRWIWTWTNFSTPVRHRIVWQMGRQRWSGLTILGVEDVTLVRWCFRREPFLLCQFLALTSAVRQTRTLCIFDFFYSAPPAINGALDEPPPLDPPPPDPDVPPSVPQERPENGVPTVNGTDASMTARDEACLVSNGDEAVTSEPGTYYYGFFVYSLSFVILFVCFRATVADNLFVPVLHFIVSKEYNFPCYKFPWIFSAIPEEEPATAACLSAETWWTKYVFYVVLNIFRTFSARILSSFHSLGPIGAPKGRRAKCKLSPLSAFFSKPFLGWVKNVELWVLDMLLTWMKSQNPFLPERDPTTGSGITGLQSSEFPSLKRLFFGVA